MKRVTVVIPNWNGMRYLKGCLDSLRSQTVKDFDVLMVDNGSTDESVSFVRQQYPEVRIRELDRNTGFCHAVNEGVRLSHSEYVLLLNNDVECDPAFVQNMLCGIEARPRAFSCQAKLVCLHNPEITDDAGDYYCALGWAFAYGKGKPQKLYRRKRRIFASCAGAAIYRRACFRRTGVFDERHFAYLEDIDLGYRAALCGYENWFLPDALVRHAGSGTSGSRYNDFKVRLAARNSIYLIRKNMPSWQIALNLPFLLAGFGTKFLFFARKGFRKTYLTGLREGIRSSDIRYRDRLPVSVRIRPGRSFVIQSALWGNVLRLLFSIFDKGESI